ncbi:hypothetical protein RDV89_02250 [Nocardioides zeae]|uniref:GPI inositol-deacylase PGAP1-like alpha/beta domain-containing protein n=1 Tax=Nocardioides imazamoxiresistens TaxID=3231893 RepID=A0ABU3PRM0_9ACTN|nr:hypothetical protein [Nocardioides zeae]MDT9591874.1 hypothetical protein [Nocardioides zeae]
MATAPTLPAVTPAAPTREPGLLDALGLLLEVVDDLVVGTVRDTHRAVAGRVRAAGAPLAAHDLVARGVYAGIGTALRGAGRGLDALAGTGAGPALEARPAGRHLRAAVNGLIGDRLVGSRPVLAIPAAPRVDGRDVPVTPTGLAAAYPDARGRVVVLLHGLGESDETWRLGRGERGTTYAEELAAAGWTPVVLRMNTGLGLRPNGVALAALLEDLVRGWPTEVERLALVGHSMGGLVVRAATAVAGDLRWPGLVSDVVTLGTPHRGAPLAELVGNGSAGLALLGETAAFGRILDERSVGIRDLVEGLGHDVGLLEHARYRLVAGTVTTSARHPVGALLGDLLVREASAHGRRGTGWDDLFADADVTTVHVGGAGHFALLNHPTVAAHLLDWLA